LKEKGKRAEKKRTQKQLTMLKIEIWVLGIYRKGTRRERRDGKTFKG